MFERLATDGLHRPHSFQPLGFRLAIPLQEYRVELWVLNGHHSKNNRCRLRYKFEPLHMQRTLRLIEASISEDKGSKGSHMCLASIRYMA
jgi:hypothetical protein